MGHYVQNTAILAKFDSPEASAKFQQEYVDSEKAAAAKSDFPNHYVIPYFEFNQISADTLLGLWEDDEHKGYAYRIDNMLPAFLNQHSISEIYVYDYYGDFCTISYANKNMQGFDSADPSPADMFGAPTWDNFMRNPVLSLFHPDNGDMQAFEEFAEGDYDIQTEYWQDGLQELPWQNDFINAFIKSAEQDLKRQLPDIFKKVILKGGVYDFYFMNEYFPNWLKEVYEDYLANHKDNNSDQPTMESVLRENMNRFRTKNLL
jgi:hypothetical protein